MNNNHYNNGILDVPSSATLRSPQARTPCGTATLINGVWVFANDTPSRHPCKESVTRSSNKNRRFIFNPYRAQVVLGKDLEQEKQTTTNNNHHTDTTAPTAESGKKSLITNVHDNEDDDDDGVVETAFDDVLPVANNNQQSQAPYNNRHNAPPPAAPTIITTIPMGGRGGGGMQQQQQHVFAMQPQQHQDDHHQGAHQAQLSANNLRGGLGRGGKQNQPNHLYGDASTEQQSVVALQPKAYLVRFKFAEGLFAAPVQQQLLMPNGQQQQQPASHEGSDSDHNEEGKKKPTNNNGGNDEEDANAQHARKKHNEPLEVGDLVVVEGDRGENIGVITDIGACEDIDRLRLLPLIIRHAMNKDRKRYYHARRKDALASRSAQQYARELNLPMNVLDAEFQVDLQKLTLYYRSFSTNNSRAAPPQEVDTNQVDFRQLQRSLYKIFRCRIWLVNWDSDPRLQEMVKLQVQPPSGTQGGGSKQHAAAQQSQPSRATTAAEMLQAARVSPLPQRQPSHVDSHAPAQFQSADWASRVISTPGGSTYQAQPRPTQYNGDRLATNYHHHAQPASVGSFTVMGTNPNQPVHPQLQPYYKTHHQQQHNQHVQQQQGRRFDVNQQSDVRPNVAPAFFSHLEKRSF